MRLIFTLSLFLFFLSNGFAGTDNGGYRIEVQLDNFDRDTLLLGYYYGKAQYIKDTATLEKGKFVFEGTDKLKPGVYLIVIPPDNKFIHILITEELSRFSMSVDLENIVPTAKFKGSAENELYYNYLRELDKRRPIADTLKKQMTADTLQRAIYQKQIDQLDIEVKNIQEDIRAKHPASLTAKLISANREIKLPEYPELSDEDRRLNQFDYYRAHYFDHFDLADSSAMRSGIIQTKVDYYLQKLTHQIPDSQIVAMDYLLGKMKGNKEAFQYYLVQFLNESARSKRLGMDAVYVHLIDEYYAKGHASWTDQEQLEKLMSQAATTRPILIGKIAPDLTFAKENGESVSIHGIDAEYTVLFFWDPECGHCKKSLPFIIDFYNEYKDKGVEILAICTKTGQDISSCWSMVKEKGMDIWVNASDQYIRNRYKTIYDVKTTPQIFILDKDKKIIVKKISGEDLMSVMNDITKMEK